MNDTEIKAKPRYSLPQRIVRIFLKTLVGILAFFILVIILIQTPPVQNFARKKIQNFLSKKLQTKVEIGHLYLGLPKKIILENVYIEDRQRDTLLSGGKLKVDISLFRLFDNVLEINEINLEGVTAKIKRTLPDTVYNFQFIIDAFAPAKPAARSADTAAMKMSIDYVTLDKIRMVYQDVVTGSDMDVWLEHFDSHIKTFDPVTMTYDIPVTNLKGVRAKIYQRKPLMVAEPLSKDAAQAAAPIPFNFNFDELDIEDIDIDYRNDVSAFYTRLKLGDLLVRSNDIDLMNRVINLQELHLNETQALITMGRKEAARVVVKEIKKEVELEAQNDWRIVVGTVRLNNNLIQMNDENKPRLRNGMDFAHLKAENLSFHINNLLFSKDSIAGEITKGELQEQSGFTLKTLQSNFLYASNQAYLHDLLLETPGTVLRRSATLSYPSIEAVTKDLSRLQLDLDLDNARIQVKDILTFAPDLRAQPAFSNPNAIWRANGNITGSIANLNFSPLQLQGLQNTRLDITGNISGLPDVNKLRGNLVIRNLLTSRTDIMTLTPKGTIPSTITLPQNINVQGTIQGGMTAVNTNLRINTSLGSAAINGTLQNLTSPANLQYNVQVGTRNLDLGTILQNDSTFGTFSADFKAVGRGTDPATANAAFDGTIHSAVFNNYNYKNVQLEGKLADQRATASVNIADPNIDLRLTGTTFLGSKYPSIHIDAFVDSIKTQPLNLTPQSVVYHGKISADFPITDPVNLQGELLVTESVLVNEGKRVQFDSIQVSAGRSDSGQFIRVRSDAANLAMEGNYNLMQLATVFQDAIQPYFAIVPSYKAVPVDPYNFTLRGTIVNHPTLQTFIPGLETLEPVTIDGRFSNTNGWRIDMATPLLVFGVNRIEGIQFNAGTGQNGIVFEAGMNKFSSGTAMNIYRTTIGGKVANNQVNFNLNVKDKTSKNKYQLAGLFQQPSSGDYAVSLRQDSLLLNYDRWSLSEGNSINFGTSGVYARNFALSKGPETLSINSLSPSGTAPVEVRFSNFQIGTILGFIQSDTLIANGALNGELVLNNLMTQPTFTGDITVQDLSVKNDTVGNLRMIVNNTTKNKYTADVRLTGFGNDLQLSGDYNVLPNNNSFYDLVLDVRQLQLASLEGLSTGAFYNGKGYVSGKFIFNGSLKDPNIDGSLNFFNAGFTPTALGSHFTIEKESIMVMNNEGVRFNTFTVKDTLGNTAVLDGMAYTTNFMNYNFDLTLRVRDFQALDTEKAPKQLYYGQLYFSSNMTITGTEKAPVIDGSLSINEKTKLTVVLPQKQVGVVDHEGIVEFVDMDSLSRDSLFLVFDTLNKSSLIGFDIALNVEVNKAAELTVIVDQGTGDFLRMRGEGLLTAGIDPGGKITLSGSYEIEDGAYELSFNFLRRRFLLQKGSRIVWSGEPTDAELDITAIYIANTAPIDLVSNYLDQPASELVTYRQKLPFEVNLMLDGPLMKPEITFDVVLPEKNYGVSNDIVTTVNYRLDEIRTQPSELNKQVFALLLLNRFVGENPFESSGGGGGIDAGNLARQSVSRLLTEQLNQLAGSLIQGVDINFDLVSTEDYTAGYMQNRTDFNVALSKRLLDERLTVTVGTNFELEGPAQTTSQSGSSFAPNISLDYLLSKDGKYKLRAYRKNEYEGVVEGYVIETGIGFSITLDYNRFRNLFRKPRPNRRNAPAPTEPGNTTPATVTEPETVSKKENEFPW